MGKNEPVEKFCVICGKKIEHAKANSKTCCDKECMRLHRIAHTRYLQEKRKSEDPNYTAMVNKRAREAFHRRKERVSELEAKLFLYKADEVFSIIKSKLLDCADIEPAMLDEMFGLAKKAMLEPNEVDSVIATLKGEEDAGTV